MVTVDTWQVTLYAAADLDDESAARASGVLESELLRAIESAQRSLLREGVEVSALLTQ